MGKSAPGKADREGIGLVTLLRMFPNDEAARAWFESKMWAAGPHCPIAAASTFSPASSTSP